MWINFSVKWVAGGRWSQLADNLTWILYATGRHEQLITYNKIPLYTLLIHVLNICLSGQVLFIRLMTREVITRVDSKVQCPTFSMLS